MLRDLIHVLYMALNYQLKYMPITEESYFQQMVSHDNFVKMVYRTVFPYPVGGTAKHISPTTKFVETFDLHVLEFDSFL